MHETRRAEIAALLAAITPGPWHWEGWDEHGPVPADELPFARPMAVYYAYLSATKTFIVEGDHFEESWDEHGETMHGSIPYVAVRPADAAFIAAAPDIVRELLAALYCSRVDD